MIIEINNGVCSAKINSTGAHLMSFVKDNGQEALWQADAKYWPCTAPVLFPIVGAVRDNKTNIYGKATEITKHGIVRYEEFELASKTDDEAVFTIESSPKLLEIYPFHFRLSVCFKLEGKKLINSYKVENLGDGTMPFCVGGHPGFNIPMVEGESFEDYVIEFSDNETQGCPVVDMERGLIDFTNVKLSLNDERVIPARREIFTNDALIFNNLNSSTVTLKSTKSSASVTMDISQFPMLGIWSPNNGAPFIALEPWVGCGTTTQEGDALEEKMHCQFVKKGEVYQVAYSVSYTL